MTLSEHNARFRADMEAWRADIRRRRRAHWRSCLAVLAMAAAVGALTSLL